MWCVDLNKKALLHRAIFLVAVGALLGPGTAAADGYPEEDPALNNPYFSQDGRRVGRVIAGGDGGDVGDGVRFSGGVQAGGNQPGGTGAGVESARPCELTGSCEAVMTLKHVDQVSERRALLRAQAELQRAQNELQEIRCEGEKDCLGRHPAERAAQAAAAQAQQRPSLNGVFMISIYGVGERVAADLLIDGSRRSVRIGSQLPDGRVISSITADGVRARAPSGQEFLLPGAASLLDEVRGN